MIDGFCTPGSCLAQLPTAEERYRLNLEEIEGQEPEGYRWIPLPQRFTLTFYITASESDYEDSDDFWYSATGIPMQGTGLTADGEFFHLGAYDGWVNAAGEPTGMEEDTGQWSNGPPARVINPSFKEGRGGASEPSQANKTVASDPYIVATGSVLYIDSLWNTSDGGVFVATDTGGWVDGYHLDVYVGLGFAALDRARSRHPGVSSSRVWILVHLPGVE